MILGVDPGARRTGLAVADRETRFARPLEVVDSEREDPVRRITEIVREMGIDLIVIGRPVGLSGRPGPAVDSFEGFVRSVRSETGIAVVEHDERLTTALAERHLREAGGKKEARAAIRDAVAAQLLLQSFLDAATAPSESGEDATP